MTYAAQARNLLFPKPPALNQEESLKEQEETGSGILTLISSLEENGFLLGCGFLATNISPLFWNNPNIINQIRIRGHDLLKKLVSETHDPIQLVLAHIFLAKLYSNPLGSNVEQQAMYTHYRRLAANILVEAFAENANRSSFLVSGFNVRTNLAERWEIELVGYEIQEGHMQYSDEGALITSPGAFQILIGISEYEQAFQIADSTPEAFQYPGICGWREVCRAFMSKEDPSAYYLKAAEFFASDILPEKPSDRSSPYWTGLNSQTLAPYFRARAVLSKPNADPSETIEALKKAAGEIELRMSGFVYPPARSLAILVHALGSFLVSKDESVLDRLSQDYQKEMKLWSSHSENDEILLNSLSLISKAIEGFRYDPNEELKSTRLSEGINGLESIPESSQFQFVSQLVPVFTETALEVSQGTTYGEVNSTLQLIEQENELQKLMLLLLQARGPLHAKITCGPLEYGKDIIAVVDDGSVAILHFYAMKVGDIDRSKWNSVKESIDQMFTVPVDNPIINQITPAKIRGFLVFNGHFNVYLDPIVSAWLNELTSRGWDITIMDLDSLGKWIVSKRLVWVLRKFVSNEFGG